MIILLEIAISLFVLILSYIFWELVGAKRQIVAALRDQRTLNDLVGRLYRSKFFELKAEEANESGKAWVSALPKLGYEKMLAIEAESSMAGFNRVRNVVGLFLLSALVLIFLYSTTILLVINLGIFFLGYIAPQSGAASKRVEKELAALSWLIYHFDRQNPEACSKMVGQTRSLTKIYAAIMTLR
jgi:hypothetical protein